MFSKKVFLVVMVGADKNQIAEMQEFLKDNKVSAKVVNKPIEVQVL